MLWIKDGKLFNGRIVIDGVTSFVTDPDMHPELMRRAGYEEYTPPAPEPAPKRYSKLEIVRALGSGWEVKKLQLEQAGLFDQFMAAAWLAEDDPAFAAVYATLTDAEKEALEECLYE